MVIAGPGSGKTTVLTDEFLHIVLRVEAHAVHAGIQLDMDMIPKGVEVYEINGPFFFGAGNK